MSDGNLGPGYSDATLRQHEDPQTKANTEALESAKPDVRSNVRNAADPHSTAGIYNLTGGQYEIMSGVVLFAFPYLHVYKVQIDGMPATTAISASSGPLAPVGATDSSLFRAGANVLLAWPKNSNYPYIVGSVPYLSSADRKNLASCLQAGSNIDITKTKAYRDLPATLQHDGHFQNYGCGRPLDGNSLESSITTETGVSFLIDPYQAALFINEACGLFLNWFDNYAKLVGFQLDIESYASHIRQRYDEGENVYFHGGCVYPWESVGSYKSGQDFTQKRQYKEYQLSPDVPYAGLDLKEDAKDLAPIYRTMEYGGYLGQGYSRMLMKPAKESGQRKFSDQDEDYGLWQETVALDGSYSVRSAKSVFISKYALIPIPKRLKKEEDTEGGDDAREDNYKFSGEFGGGDDHKVKDVKVEGDNKPLLRAAAVLDLLAYNYNWKGTHPFYYHKKDYYFPNESDLSKLESAQGKLSFGRLRSQSYLDDPKKKSLKIDSRYGNVDYFQSIAYFTILEDGGVLIGDGYGSQITMTGGQIRLEAPGDVMLMPGTRAVALCDEFFVRAKNNIELSSSEKDVRLKAEKNMQLLSGNGGSGGTLIENKSTQNGHVYKQKRGDEVSDNGITIIAKNSELGVIGEDVYVRSSAVGEGDIVLDTKGFGDVNTYLKAFNIFHTASHGVNMWEGFGAGTEEPTEASKTAKISSKGSFVGGWFAAQGHVLATQGSLLSDEGCYVAKSIIAGQSMANKSGFVGKHDGSFEDDIKSALDDLDKAVDLIRSYGDDVFKQISLQYYRQDFMLGNKEFLGELVGFSFNDKNKRSYGYKQENGFIIGQPRWQQLVDVGLADGGGAWTEKSVSYQSTDLYPWPGKSNWVDSPSMQKFEDYTFFDKEGYAKDRGESYEDPELSNLNPETPDGNYKLNGGT